MEKGNIDDFLKALFKREAGDRTSVVNYAGYAGKYQFGELALIDLGYYKSDGTSKNDWRGSWTGKHGVNSLDDFLKNTAVQDTAAKEWVALLCKRMRKLGLDKYMGKVIKGIQITDSGIIAGAHLKGFGTDAHPGVKKFLKSNGTTDPKDGLGTPVSHYVELFGGYDVGCCKKVDLSFLEKHTEKPIPGLNLLIKKNGILHQKVKSDDNGYVMPMHGFTAGDMLEVYVEKLAGGHKKIGEEIIGESDVNLIFFSPKIKAVANAEVHKGDAQARKEKAPSQKTEKEKKTADMLDKMSAAWANRNPDLNKSKTENSAPEKKDSSKKGNSTEQASKDPHANVKTERSAKGHPKAIVEKPVSPQPPAPAAAMQKIIPNLLFPLEKRPSDSYKDGARRFGANRSQGRKHAGIDLYAPVGTPIRAMADGVVIQTYAFYLDTWVVEVDHGDFIARYGEVQPLTILVKRGQKIERGQTIAHVGKLKGLSYSMLHLEMYGTNESPVGKGRGLTQKAKVPFQRREDLIDPTGSIDLAKTE
ncbi:hypothetical protein C5614_25350 [Massilia phosphatilytica]|nr:hypothetical protein C5614_25350 [Massilia phosphatilytica]